MNLYRVTLEAAVTVQAEDAQAALSAAKAATKEIEGEVHLVAMDYQVKQGAKLLKLIDDNADYATPEERQKVFRDTLSLFGHEYSDDDFESYFTFAEDELANLY